MSPNGKGRPGRAAAFRAKQAQAARRRQILIRVGAVAAGVLIAVLAIVARGSRGGSLGPEGVALQAGPLLAPADTAATGQTVDGIQCAPTEQVAYHIHTHLTVYVNGVLRPIPPGIGTVPPVAQQTSHGAFFGATTCYYWLHVHAQDGVIHIESPTQSTYTLGQFFDLWQQPLSSSQVAGATGALTIYVNGKPYQGDPRTIVLGSREAIQIDVGTPAVAPKSVSWSHSQL